MADLKAPAQIRFRGNGVDVIADIIAGRILDADGIRIDKSADLALVFVLNIFRADPSPAGSSK